MLSKRIFSVTILLICTVLHAQEPRWRPVPRIGVAIANAVYSTKNNLIGFQTGLDLNYNHRFSVGLSSGLEQMNGDSFEIQSFPFQTNMQLHLGNGGSDGKGFLYVFYRPGISLVRKATALFVVDSLPHPTLAGISTYSIQPFITWGISNTFGLGVAGPSGIFAELFVRDQPSNLLEPFQQRKFFLGLMIGQKIASN